MIASPAAGSGVGTQAALRAAIDLARYAPSLHNAQPWYWRIVGGSAELYADPTRAVPVADPFGREMLLGCGAALHHARIALAAAGWRVRVSHLPDAERPDLVARLELTGQDEPDMAAAKMAGAITRRRTDRRPFAPLPLPTRVLDALRQATEDQGAYLALLTDADDRIELAVLSARAVKIQTEDPAYEAELAAWTGERPGRDGVPPSHVPHLTEPRHSDVALRDFEETHPGAASTPAGVDEQPAWAVLYTDGDDREHHLRVGEAMSALMLTATDLGLATGVQSQPVEVAAVRAQIDGRLLNGLGHAQLAMRLGWPDPAAPDLPASPRRPLEEVLRPSR
jgi:nitroreductase